MSSVLEAALPQAPVRLAGSPGFVAPAARIADLPGPPGLPLLGHLHKFKAGRLHALFEGWAREYGPMFRFRIRSLDAVGITDPGLIGEVLRHRPAQARRSPRLAEFIAELGPPGVFTAEGDAWRRQRKLVMRALTPEAVKHFFPVIATVTGRLQAHWADAARAGRPIDVTRDLKRYSVDVTTWLAMGIDVDTLNHADDPLQSDVEFWFATIGRRIAAPLPYWRFMKLPLDRRADAMVARLTRTVDELIAGARERLDAEPARRAKPRNILEALIVARDEPGSEFSDDDVRGNVGVMLFAGEDTTANAMAWLLYFLAVTPDAAARVAAEADQVLGSAPLVPEFAALERLVYTEAAALEAMRLKPIAPVQGHAALIDLDLAGLAVPRGTLLFLLPRVAATDAGQFDDPLAFRPERWLGDPAAVDALRHKTFPFGGGARFCPGRYLAMAEIRMVVSMALRGFRVELDVEPDSIAEHFTFTLGPKTLPLRLSAR